MDISASTVWWVLAGIAVAVELSTGTFYLLLLACGMAAGALASHLGFGVPMQIVAAAAVGGGGTAYWRWRHVRAGPGTPAAENRNVNLDVGERVVVDAWNDDRTTRVQYRGSTWTAKLAPGADAVAGEHVVSAVESNSLVLAPAPPRH
jgi:membrane protein implicated in regulation of membrane protease activity